MNPVARDIHSLRAHLAILKVVRVFSQRYEVHILVLVVLLRVEEPTYISRQDKAHIDILLSSSIQSLHHELETSILCILADPPIDLES